MRPQRMTPRTGSAIGVVREPPRLRQLRAAARRRRVLGELALWLPVAFAAGWIAYRLAGAQVAVGASLVALGSIGWRLTTRWRGIDRAWLVRGLDGRDRALQDSADLLFADEATLGDLQRLQRERVLRALAAGAPDLREPWPARRIAVAWLVAAIAVATGLPWPATQRATVVPQATPAAQEVAQTLTATLRIAPPAYTGLPERRSQTLSARVESGSLIEWELRFAREPRRARLRFVEGDALELEALEGRWRGERTVERSTLYRIEFEGAPALPEAAPARLEAIPDRAPQLTVQQPERTLTVLDAQQRHWTLQFEAADDYGLGEARLQLTLAQGSGEQVTVSERTVVLKGEGDARRRRYEHRVDLAALGFAQGDDVIASLQVSDRRTPTPNTTRSASFILRWPPPASAEGTGVEGLVQKAMPAYFRSQRQIIIDTEALIAERPRLGADEALAKSDTIGADQRLLRLRYGQFLGEESETEGEAHEEEPGEAHGSAAQELMAAAGHLHDLPEAATLLDPGTRALLRNALDEMWQAERELRLGNPVAALPYENRALDFIKRAQQADRIYLARVGLELPQLDAARRLTGERGTLRGRADPAQAADAERVPERAYEALQSGGEADLDALAAWIAARRDGLDDPLVLLERLDEVRRDPDCADCRRRLARALWPVLTPPAAAPAARTRPDQVGTEYLDAMAPDAGTRSGEGGRGATEAEARR
jgi:hypothetical protein